MKEYWYDKIKTNYYKHKKGGFYKKILTALDSEDCTIERVIYKALQKTDKPKGQLWDRKKIMFDEQDRFKQLSLKETFFLFINRKDLI